MFLNILLIIITISAIMYVIGSIMEKIKAIKKSHHRKIIVRMPPEAIKNRRAFKRWERGIMQSYKL